MTTTVSIRLPEKLARKLKAKTRAAKTNPSAVLREAAEKYVAQPAKGEKLNAMQRHIMSRAGTWDGDISGEELLKMTRP
jgi:metal-responsive CopG/Arc/MetJ family transcriptional regulator